MFFILPEWGIQLEAFATAVIGLSIYAGAYISEIFCRDYDDSKGQIEAATALGHTRFQQLRYIILPQAFPDCPACSAVVGQYFY